MAYRYVTRRDHPLAPPGGKFPLHRLVLWEKIGPGTHPCFDCRAPVTWATAEQTRTGRGVLVANHMDGDTTNNDPANLEPSCQACNIRHGRNVRFADQPFLVIRGKREAAVERTCQNPACGRDFLFLKKLVGRKGNTGAFCSQRCHYDSR